ncbi:MAG TPA: IMP dehydrogenase [Chloroflexia bacterium]|jgi:IMP dehydrogenase|nr:IMP dehydrogenase [Chloroflexia bacterium]
MDEIPLSLSYDDVLLVPQRTAVRSRKQVDVSAQLSRHVRLQIPVVSANMDTVTESTMAIAMARAGGIGIIHRFLPVEQQAAEVRRVKRAENFVIDQPYACRPTDSIAHALDLMHDYDVGTLMVVDSTGTLAGMVGTRDVQFARDRTRPVESVMRPLDRLVVGPPDVSTDRAAEIFAEQKIDKLPLVDTQGRLVGLITARDMLRISENPGAAKDRRGRLLVGAAIGVIGDYMERAAALLEQDADVLVIDIAHGHSEQVIEVAKEVRARWPQVELIAGNVATAEGTLDLIAAGVDAVKVGVGPGSACTTRIVAGAGVGQFTAVSECARAARAHNIPIIADGGIKASGDLTKAMAAGAHTVMIGGMLAGTDESPGRPLTRRGRRYKHYRGMASLAATVDRRKRERLDPGADDEWVSDVVPEGVEALVAYRGSTHEVLTQLVGGLRSGMSYCGAFTLDEMYEKARFTRITSAGLRESHPHDVEFD